MNAPPMRPWQNALALGASLLAAGALLPLPGGARVMLVALAVVAILCVLLMRMRAHRVRRDAARVSGVYDRIERIRAARGPRRRPPPAP
jgi:membrane protein implicated in regulation of membrane protease activity